MIKANPSNERFRLIVESDIADRIKVVKQTPEQVVREAIRDFESEDPQTRGIAARAMGRVLRQNI